MFLSALLLVAGAVGAMATDYTVVCSLNGGGVTYSSTEYTNNGVISADALAAADLTAKAVTGYVSQVSIAGQKVYVDYYNTAKDYIIKHSAANASSAQPGWYLTYKTAGVTTREAFDHTCLWKIVQGADANTVYIETEDAVSGERLYIQEYVNNNTQVVYGSTPKPYAIERLSDTEVVLHSLAAHGTSGNVTDAALHHYLHMNGNDKVVGWTKDAVPSHWQVPVEVTTGTKTFSLTDDAGTTYKPTAPVYMLADGTKLGVGDPVLTGCTGLTTSDLVEDAEGNVTGKLVFPFPVSNATTKNWTYIGEKPGGTLCHWYTKDDNATQVFARNQNNVMPNNKAGDNDRYQFAIIPAFTNGAFTFTILSKQKGKYIHHDAITAGTDAVALTLADAGSPFTYGDTQRSGGHGFFASDGTHCISVGSMNNEQTLNMLLCDGNHYPQHQGFNDMFETPADFDALMASLRAATGYPVGTGVGKYTATDAWTTAKTEADAVTADGSTTYWTAAQFNSHLTTLNAITLNAVPAGFYTFKSAGHSLNDAEADHYLSAGDKGSQLTTTTGKDASTIFYWENTNNGTHNVYAYNKGYYLDGHSVVSEIKHVTHNADGTESITENGSQYQVTPAGAASLCPATGNTTAVYGQYRLHYWNGNVKDNGTEVTSESNNDDQWVGWVVEPVTALPLTVPETGYTTFSAPVPVTIPTDEVTAYTVSEVGDVVTLTEQTGTVPANTGLIIYKENGGEVNLTIAATAEAITGNQLQANVKATQHATADNHYFLGTVSGKTGFYRNGADGTLTGHKAYLNAPANGGEVKAFLPFDTATGIDEVNGQQSTAGGLLFDLQGRQLPRLRKGVNIVNGKKIIVK